MLIRFGLLPALIVLPVTYLLVRVIWLSLLPPPPEQGLSLDHPSAYAVELGFAILSAVVGVRIHRAIIAEESTGWTVFRFGRHELAYLGAVLIYWVLFVLTQWASSTAALEATDLVTRWTADGAESSPFSDMLSFYFVQLAFLIIMICFLSWPLARLALIFPEAAISGSVSPRKSWAATSGNLLRLLTALALLVAGMALVAIPVTRISMLGFQPLAEALGLLPQAYPVAPKQVFDSLFLIDLLGFPAKSLLFAMSVAFFSYAYIDLMKDGRVMPKV